MAIACNASAANIRNVQSKWPSSLLPPAQIGLQLHKAEYSRIFTLSYTQATFFTQLQLQYEGTV